MEIPVEGEELEDFLPNYVAVRQEVEEMKEAEPGQFPKKTAFYVETGKIGVLDAVSVSDAQYDRAGAPVQDEKEAAEHYFSHFGRMLTITDLELLLRERYPFFAVEDWAFCPKRGELEVKLTVLPQAEEGVDGRLEEVNVWLSGTVRRQGALWLQKAKVRCILSEEKHSNGKGVAEGGEDSGTAETG